MTKTTLLALMFFTSFITIAEEQKEKTTELSQHLDSITPAIAIKRIPPKYPIQAARDGAEGWVQLSFVIDTNGDVQDILVMNSAGGNYKNNRSFIKEARNALKKWQFTPAKNQQGDNISSCKNSVQLDFKMYDSGVDSDFIELLKISFQAIQTKDSNKLKELITEMEEFSRQRTSELAWTSYIKMKYFDLIENNAYTYASLKNSYKYIDLKTPRYTEPASLDILSNLLIMQVEKQLYRNARETFQTLKGFDSEYAQKLQTYYQPFMTQIDQLITGDKNILVKGKIGENTWYHDLVRNKFSIDNIKGEVNLVEIRCDYKYSTYTVKEDTAWDIPKEWGQCSIFVKGDSNATFDFYEMPEQA